MLREKMKLFLLFANLFLTLFGTSLATGNLSKEGRTCFSNYESLRARFSAWRKLVATC